jgi:paraquat-inducible protein A
MPPSPTRSPLVGLAIVVAAATLAYSYSLPTVTFERLMSDPETYSIYGGIESLWEDGNWVLASLVFFFSIVFPIVKVLALGYLWLGRGGPAQRAGLVVWLRLLGKWSMLDVFVIGAFVGSIHLGVIAQGTSRAGIYVFGAAIAMSMLTTIAVAAREPGSARRALTLGRAPLAARLLTSAGALALGAGLALSLLELSKFFITKEVSLPYTSWNMLKGSEPVLGAILLVFVVGTSSLRCLCGLALVWTAWRPRGLVRFSLLLDEWAMLDVFGLGLAIVHVKLSELAETRLLPGFWWAVAASALAFTDGLVLRRRTHSRRRAEP